MTFSMPPREEVDPEAVNSSTPEGGDSTRGDWRSRIRLTKASSIKVKRVRWLWDGRMPLGALTLVPGREGVGKSTFFAWLAAVITNGTLEGAFSGQPKAVLYAASEDAWEFTIVPRLIAAGADLDLIYRIDTITEKDGIGGGLVLPRDCGDIPEISREINAAVLLCDPILSMVDESINSFKGQELRRALEPLTRAAERADIAVPALIHFNKGGAGDVGTMIAGARAWSEVARAVVAIAEDKDADEYTCVVSQTKNNLGRKNLPHLTYTIRSTPVAAEDGEFADVGMLEWTGVTERGVEELLGQPIGVPEAKHGESMQAVLDYVQSTYDEQGRPVSSGDVVAALDGEIKPATVRQTLARAVKAGKLESPIRNVYKPAGVTSGVTTPGSANPQVSLQGSKMPDSFPLPSTPPVTTSQLSQQQVKGGIGGVTNESGSCRNCHKQLAVGQAVTCDSCDKGIRAREEAACRACLKPTTRRESDGLVICDACAGDGDGTAS